MVLFAFVLSSGCFFSPPSDKPAGVPAGELSWWPTKATPEPVDDPEGGKWWWPTEVGDETQRAWGNRGVVYLRRAEAEKIPLAVRPIAAIKLKSVHFDFDKYALSPEGQEILRGVAERLKENPDVAIVVEGHCCSCGSAQYNMALGRRRARSVHQFLSSEGIAPNRMLTRSYGETRAIDPGGTDEAHAKNRRVQFKVSAD